MKPILLSAALVLPLQACAATTPDTATEFPPPASASKPKNDESWTAFGHALTLAQVMIRIAAHSENPEQGYEDVLAGRSTEANRAITGLLEEATAGMPPEYRSRVASIGQDVVSLARKEMAKPTVAAPDRALQARKDLTAMGLRYHDTNEFLEAVKRDDALAVELFFDGRGVNLGARDAQGRTALDIARAHQPMAQLLAISLPAAR